MVRDKSKAQAPHICGPLVDSEKKFLLSLFADVTEAAAQGHPQALARLSELLIDDSLLSLFDRRDHQLFLEAALSGLEQGLEFLRPAHYAALCAALARRGIANGAARLLRMALGRDQHAAWAALRSTVLTPGPAAERAADVLASRADALSDNDLLAVGVRALQSGRRGRARKLLERLLADAHPVALQAIRTVLWRRKDFVDLDHNETRLRAALQLSEQPTLMANEDLAHLREIAVVAQGDELLRLYLAADQCVDRQPPLEDALQTYTGIVSDAELGDEPERGEVIKPLAQPRVIERFDDADEDRNARRALAPLALIWAEHKQQQVDAARLLQRPALGGEHNALAAACLLCTRQDADLDSQAVALILDLIEDAAVAGQAAEIVALLIEHVQHAGDAPSPRLLEATRRAAQHLPCDAILRTLLAQALRPLSQDGPVQKEARAVLNEVFADVDRAQAETVVRPRPRQRTTAPRLRSGLGGQKTHF